MPNSSSLPGRRAWLLGLAFLIAGCGKKDAPEGAAPQGPIKVAAASDLALAFKEMGAAFEKKSGRRVVFSFGSSGNFAKQIAEGAQYDLFASANTGYVDEVVKAGACEGETKALYGRGRIALWSKKGGVAPPTKLEDLTDARFVKIAIANPEHAPYGKAAKEALVSAGVWDRVLPKIVNAENIMQTLQFAQTGNVEVSVVALSLAMTNEEGSYVLIDEAQHKPLDQALVVCKRGGDPQGGKDLSAFIASGEGRAIMIRYGFALPGEVVVKAP
jgi:molybdate transport system substrate-binding protein